MDSGRTLRSRDVPEYVGVYSLTGINPLDRRKGLHIANANNATLGSSSMINMHLTKEQRAALDS